MGIARSIPGTDLPLHRFWIINTSLCLLQTAQVCINEVLGRSFWLLCSAEAQLLTQEGLQGWILIKPPGDYEM